MKKYLSALVLASLVTITSQLTAAAAAPEAIGELQVVANEPLGESATWAQGSTSTPIEILEHEGSLSSVRVGEGFGLLSTNASTSADDVAAAFVTSDGLSLAWDFQDELQVAISLDGEPLTVEASDGSLNIDNAEINPGSEVSFLQLDPATEETELSTFSAVALPLIQPSQPTLYSATQTLLAATVSPPAATVLRYQTFIKDAYVAIPSACESGYLNGLLTWGYYKGNNRNFSAGSSNNKTAMQVNIGWDTESVTLNKTVGATEIYELYEPTGQYSYVTTKQASSAGLTVSYGTFYTNSVYVHLQHDVDNPDCEFWAQPIYYNVAGKIYRAGGYALSGEFRQAPWHEFYIKDSNNTTWSYIYRADINPDWGFGCFNPLVNCLKSGSWNTPNTTWYH